MKILFIEPFLFRFARGIERFTLDLANQLVKKNIDVSILCWKEKKKYHLTEIDSRVKIFEIPTFRYYVAKTVIPFYIFHLFKYQYDIINIFFPCYGESEAIKFVSKFKRLRYNINFHYPVEQVPHKYKEFQEYGLIKNVDMLVSVSRFVANGVKRYFKRESVVIYNGIDCKKFIRLDLVSTEVEKIKKHNNQKILLTVGALEERKGIQKVIEALPVLKRQGINFRYIILGEGDYKYYLEKRIQELCLSENVVLLGAHSDLLPYYNLADVFLLLSYGEAFGLVLIEAMACELPVIVSQQPPFDEIINDSCGIMVNENNPEEVSQAILKLLENDNLRKEMGKKAREYILKNFSWDIIANKYLKLFESQLKE
jgi:glycosyltransferase involved in cell wall biosynthesis